MDDTKLKYLRMILVIVLLPIWLPILITYYIALLIISYFYPGGLITLMRRMGTEVYITTND